MQTKYLRSKHLRSKHLRLCLSAALALLALTPAALAQTRYLVTVDTSALNGTAGNLDFQFNPGGADAQNANLVISSFATDGTLTGTAVNTGDAFHTLPGSLLLDNGAVYNDVFQGITYGNALSFVATFSGPALTPPSGTTSGSVFSFSLYDNAAPPNALLTTDPGGSVAQIIINNNGSVTTQTFPATVGGISVATVRPAPVPEASSAISLGLLLGLGMGGLALSARLRKRQPARSF